MADILTIGKYLSGKVRNITVPDDAVASFIMDAGCKDIDGEKVTKDTDVTLLSERERELCLAWLFVWIAGSPTQSGGFSEEDADWKSTENGERMSASVLKNYLAMANRIFEKYGLDVVSTGKWGFRGQGIHDRRNY